MTGIPAAIRQIDGLNEALDGVKAVICDLWGVVHDGIRVHSDAIVCLDQLAGAGIPVVLLSNAPRPVDYTRTQILDMGLPVRHSANLLTSGSISRRQVVSQFEGARLYHMGPATDSNLLEGLPVTLVDTPGEADVILASGLDFDDVEAHRSMLGEAASNATPMICANPDRIVHVGDRLWLCAGAVAALYDELGGIVVWAGKPEASAMKSALTEIEADHLTGGEVLVIGDGLFTDIRGANNAGFKSLLISGGVHRAEMAGLEHLDGDIAVADYQAVFDGHVHVAVPDMIMPHLVWQGI